MVFVCEDAERHGFVLGSGFFRQRILLDGVRLVESVACSACRGRWLSDTLPLLAMFRLCDSFDAGVGCRSPGRFSFEERDARLMHTFAKAICIAPMLAKLVRLAIAPMLAKFVHLAPVLENLRELTAHYVQILSAWDN